MSPFTRLGAGFDQTPRNQSLQLAVKFSGATESWGQVPQVVIESPFGVFLFDPGENQRLALSNHFAQINVLFVHDLYLDQKSIPLDHPHFLILLNPFSFPLFSSNTIKLLKGLVHFQAKQIRRLESVGFSVPKNFAAIASFSAQTA